MLIGFIRISVGAICGVYPDGYSLSLPCCFAPKLYEIHGRISIRRVMKRRVTAATDGPRAVQGLSPIPGSESEQDLRRAFNLFDEDRSGFISPEEFRKAMKKLGNRQGVDAIDDAEIDDLIKKADADHDGEICYKE
jgi:hypothetical protein